MAKRRNPAASTLVTADDEEVANANPLPVSVQSGSVSVGSALPTGDNTIGRVKLTDGTTVLKVAVEDDPHVSGDSGVQLLAVRNDDSGTAMGGSNADYTPVAVNARGNPMVVGPVGHDGALASPHNPLVIGGYASAAAPSDVSGDGDAVRAWLLRNGAQVVSQRPPDIDITTHSNYARKYYANTGAVTDGIVWSPASGKRWHITSIFIGVSAACTVTLEDDKAGGDDPVWKHEFAADGGWSQSYDPMYPLASGEDAADLLVTTTAGNVVVVAIGYEV